MRRNRGSYTEAQSDVSTGIMDILCNSLGAVLFLLILMMIIMVLLPKAMASLKDLRILGDPAEVVQLPRATVGLDYRTMFATEGGEEYINCELTEGALPPGLDWINVDHPESDIVTRSGIGGVPTEAGIFEFVVTAKSYISTSRSEEAKDWPESKKASPPRTFRVEVVPPALRRDTSALVINAPDVLGPTPCILGSMARVPLSARGGVQPYTWSIVEGSIEGAEPDALSLSLDDSGVLTARPKQPVEVAFDVRVESSQPADSHAKLTDEQAVATKSIRWTLVPGEPELTILTPDVLPEATGGQPYQLALAARGGTGVYAWSLLPAEEGSTVPSWLGIDGQVLKGKPAVADIRKEPYRVRIEVDDGYPGRTSTSKVVQVKVVGEALVTADPDDPAQQVKIITGTQLPDATEGLHYGVTFAAHGGRPPYHWKITKFAVDKNGVAAAADLSELGLTLIGSPPTSAGDPPSGWFSGIPKAIGNYTLTAQVWDSNFDGSRGERTDEKVIELKIRSGPESASEPLRITTPSHLPYATSGQPYEAALAAVGGVPPYTWRLAGETPSFLKLEDAYTGKLLGQPQEENIGKYTFTILLQDDRGAEHACEADVKLIVRPGPKRLRMLTTRLPDASLGGEYEAYLLAEGGDPPFSWTVLEGALPEGIILDEASGKLTGTPRALGSDGEPMRFRIGVTDAGGSTDEREFGIVVAALVRPRPLTIATDTMPPAVAGEAGYRVRLAASGGVPPYTWRPGENWPGRTAGRVILTDSGLLANEQMFPAEGQHELEIHVSDATGNGASKLLKVSVLASGSDVPPLPVEPDIKLQPLKIKTKQVPPIMEQTDFQFALAADGGLPPYSWSVEGDLPEGVSLADGYLSGKIASVPDKPLNLMVVVQDSKETPTLKRQRLRLAVQSLGKQGDVVKRIWRIFIDYLLGYTVIILAYLVLGAMNSADFQSKKEKLNVIIVDTPNGVSVDGPDRADFIDLAKSARERLLGFRTLAAIALVINTLYILIW